MLQYYRSLFTVRQADQGSVLHEQEISAAVNANLQSQFTPEGEVVGDADKEIMEIMQYEFGQSFLNTQIK